MKNKLFKLIFSMLTACLLAITLHIPLTATSSATIYDNGTGNALSKAGTSDTAEEGYDSPKYGGYRFAIVAAKDYTTVNGKTYDAGEVVSRANGKPMVVDLMHSTMYYKAVGAQRTYKKVRTSDQNFSSITILDIDDYIKDGLVYPAVWTGGGYKSNGEGVKNWLKSESDIPNQNNLTNIITTCLSKEACDLVTEGKCKVVMEPLVYIPLYANYVSRGYEKSGEVTVTTTSGDKIKVYGLNSAYYYHYEDFSKEMSRKYGSNASIVIDPVKGFFGKGHDNRGGRIAVRYWGTDEDGQSYESGFITRETLSSWTGEYYYGTIYGYLKACDEFKTTYKNKVNCKGLYPNGIGGDGLTFMSPIKDAVPCGFRLAENDSDLNLTVPSNPNKATTWGTIKQQGYGIHIYESKAFGSTKKEIPVYYHLYEGNTYIGNVDGDTITVTSTSDTYTIKNYQDYIPICAMSSNCGRIYDYTDWWYSAGWESIVGYINRPDNRTSIVGNKLKVVNDGKDAEEIHVEYYKPKTEIPVYYYLYEGDTLLDTVDGPSFTITSPSDQFTIQNYEDYIPICAMSTNCGRIDDYTAWWYSNGWEHIVDYINRPDNRTSIVGNKLKVVNDGKDAEEIHVEYYKPKTEIPVYYYLYEGDTLVDVVEGGSFKPTSTSDKYKVKAYSDYTPICAMSTNCGGINNYFYWWNNSRTGHIIDYVKTPGNRSSIVNNQFAVNSSGSYAKEIHVAYFKPVFEYITSESTAEYHTDTNVYTSFSLENDSGTNLTSGTNDFSYTITSGSSTISSGTISFNCPNGEKTLGYFRWKTPRTAQELTLTIKSTKAGAYIIDGNGERCTTLIISANISKLAEKTPPDPKVTDKKPAWFTSYTSNSVLNSVSQYAPLDGKNELTWYEWTYENGTPKKIERKVSLSATMQITPSRRCYTAIKNNATGKYTMKSGYGIQVSVTPRITGDTAYCTGAQTANVLFPEFNYNKRSASAYNRLLEKSGNSFVFKTNEYSTYNDRVHFTPIWYPDIRYTAYGEVLDVWCPAGQLSVRLTDYMTIKGNVYDDWHVAPGKP